MKDSVAYTQNKSEDHGYNHLISEDNNEFSIEGYLHGHSETRQTVNGPSTQTYKLTTAILGILCAVLMATVIGLYVSYKGLNEEHIVLSQNTSETNSNLEQLKANHDLLTVALMKFQRSFQEAVRAKDSMQMVRNIERQGKELLQRQTEALMNEETKLRARITTLEKSCQRCPVGWDLLHSSCYFVPSTESGQKLSWHQSRKECKKSEADLAVIDSQEKQEFISSIIERTGRMYGSWQRGFWIGLRDVETEGVWKWLNGTELTEGFWYDHEPNDMYLAEDCAATYARENPLKSWNDAPCDYPLKWICETKL